MSESTSEATAEAGKQQTNAAEEALGDAGKQALDRMKSERNEARQAAATLKAQLDEINKANETAVERATREATEAKAQLEQVPALVADGLRDYLADLHSFSDEDRSLYLTSNDPAVLLKQAAGLVARTPNGPRPDPSQGAKGGDAKGTTADLFAAAVDGAFTR